MTTATEYQLSPRRTLTAGVACSLKHLRGVWKFVHVSTSTQGAVSLTFVGGPAGHREYRSVRPDRIKAIHRTPQ
ncbi:hypothetical protein ACFVUS_12375 [Nocardia sp. NPDC058058]|uniref:DUF7246 family protein n=1 Tax=Nocardia sp. NPDC058058 TaxID=3346317 RepID=UPI0036DBC3E0